MWKSSINLKLITTRKGFKVRSPALSPKILYHNFKKIESKNGKFLENQNAIIYIDSILLQVFWLNNKTDHLFYGKIENKISLAEVEFTSQDNSKKVESKKYIKNIAFLTKEWSIFFSSTGNNTICYKLGWNYYKISWCLFFK